MLLYVCWFVSFRLTDWVGQLVHFQLEIGCVVISFNKNFLVASFLTLQFLILTLPHSSIFNKITSSVGEFRASTISIQCLATFILIVEDKLTI